MIEEHGRVVAVESGAVWVETVRRNTCSSCQASSGCGHRVLDEARAGTRARIRALVDASAEVGDRVTIGIPEDLLLRGTLRVYLLPLLLLFAGAIAGHNVFGGETAAMGLGLAGLGAGFAYNRWYSRHHENDRAQQPRVLRVLPGTDESFTFQ